MQEHRGQQISKGLTANATLQNIHNVSIKTGVTRLHCTLKTIIDGVFSDKSDLETLWMAGHRRFVHYDRGVSINGSVAVRTRCLVTEDKIS